MDISKPVANHCENQFVASAAATNTTPDITNGAKEKAAIMNWEDFVRRSMLDLGQTYQKLLFIENGAELEEFRLMESLDHLSEIHHALGNYGIAEGYYNRSLKIKEKRLVKGDDRLVRAYLNLGILHRVQNRFDQAEEFYLRAYADANPNGKNNCGTSSCLFYRVGLHYAKGNYGEAEVLLRRALIEHEASTQTSDFEKALGRTVLGLVKFRQGEKKEGKAHLLSAKQLADGETGKLELNIQSELLRMALIYCQWERFDDAEILVRQAVVAREEHLWQYQPQVPQAMLTIANLCRARGQFDQAESMYWAALEKQAKGPGPYQTNMIDALVGLAQFYNARMRFESAAPLLETALKLSETLLGEKHRDTVLRIDQYAAILDKLGKFQTAEGLRKRSSAIKEESYRQS